MAKEIVAGELYENITGQLFEIGRQLRQPNGYPFNPRQLKVFLQAAIEGRFTPREVERYVVKLGGNISTDDLVRTWKNENYSIDWHMTQENFPLRARAEEYAIIEVIDPNDSLFERKEGVEYLKAAGLKLPTHEQAIRFAEQYGRMVIGKKSKVIFLLSSALKKGTSRPCDGMNVHRDRRSPGLYLIEAATERHGTVFDDECLLAGVRTSE